MPESNHLIVSEDSGVTIVHFVERKIVDAAKIEHLGEELLDLVNTDGCTNLLLNFDGVEFLGSAVLNKLISLRNAVRKVGGSLKLCNLRTEIMEIFTITNLDRIFDIRRSQAEAIQAFQL
jgi:anti-sigma B factor antagonist